MFDQQVGALHLITVALSRLHWRVPLTFLGVDVQVVCPAWTIENDLTYIHTLAVTHTDVHTYMRTYTCLHARAHTHTHTHTHTK